MAHASLMHTGMLGAAVMVLSAVPQWVSAASAFVCITPTHRIEVEAAGGGDAYEYRSWRLNKPGDGPALTLRGTMEVQGTGPCRTRYWNFKNGKYEYVITDSANCGEQVPPAGATGQLAVSLSGKEISQSWCSAANATVSSDPRMRELDSQRRKMQEDRLRLEAKQNKQVVGIRDGSMDVRAVAFQYGGMLVVAKISESEGTWFGAIRVSCTWRDKVGEAINGREFFRPGMRAGVHMDKWSDGSAVSVELVKLDTKHREGPSRVMEDSDIPRCRAISARPLTAQQVSEEAERPDPSDDPYLRTQQAYLSFDGRCRQIAGASTAELLSKVREIRRMGGNSQAGIGSVQGHLAMLRSVGCAPR